MRPWTITSPDPLVDSEPMDDDLIAPPPAKRIPPGTPTRLTPAPATKPETPPNPDTPGYDDLPPYHVDETKVEGVPSLSQEEFKREYGKGWSDPKERAERLRRKGVKESIVIPPQVEARLVPAKERYAAEMEGIARDGLEVGGHTFRGKLALQLYRLGPPRRKVLLAFFTTEKRTDAKLAEIAGVRKRFVQSCRRDPYFLDALGNVLEATLPGKRIELMAQMIDDALTPLASISGQKAGALMKAREQAAQILNIDLAGDAEGGGPQKHLHAHMHMFANAPDDALDDWMAKGKWDRDKHGPPPWESR